MCESCYENYGSPTPDDKARECVPLIEAVYNEHCAGGDLHILLDDWNLENRHLKACEKYELTAAERACLNFMLEMTENQRAAALALFDGFVR